MSLFRRALVAAAAAGVPLALAAPAVHAAAPSPAPAPAGAVYVLSNQPAGNAVIAYDRAADGSLTLAATYPTGGTGTGGGLGSQGAVIVDRGGRYLYAVNAGDDSITSFRITSTGRLRIVDREASGGVDPVSLAIRNRVLYVLNAGGSGNVSGFSTSHGDLTPLAGSTQPLSSPSAAAAQVSFTPDGTALVVSEKATNRFSVFPVGAGGVAGAAATAPSAGTTPFGFAFTRKGVAVVSEAFGGAADASAVSSYTFAGGTLATVSSSVPTTETAACWIALSANHRYAYAGNAGAASASVTGYRIGADGSLKILDADGKTGTAPAGVADLATTASGFLYGRISNGSVAGWAIQADGSLTSLGTTPGLPAGAAGIAAR